MRSRAQVTRVSQVCLESVEVEVVDQVQLAWPQQAMGLNQRPLQAEAVPEAGADQ